MAIIHKKKSRRSRISRESVLFFDSFFGQLRILGIDKMKNPKE
jgi:hypothetical protein